MSFFQVVREYKYDGETHEAFFEQEADAVSFVEGYDVEQTSADLVILECWFDEYSMGAMISATPAKRVERHRYSESNIMKHVRVGP